MMDEYFNDFLRERYLELDVRELQRVRNRQSMVAEGVITAQEERVLTVLDRAERRGE